MEGLFGLLGMIALGAAFACLIPQIAHIGITSRRRALWLGVASLVFAIAGLVLLGLAGQRDELKESGALQPTVAQSTPQPTAPPTGRSGPSGRLV